MLFPLVLLPLGVFVRRRFLAVFLILAALSLALAEWGSRNYPSENFYFTFSRLWEILSGSICAAILFRRAQMSNDALAFVGLAMIVASIVLYTSEVPFPSLYTLLPVVGSMLITLFADSKTWTVRLLSVRPMVVMGILSYSAYLWHQPLFAFARIRSLSEPSLWLMSALAVATLMLAWLTVRYVEAPFRRRTLLPRRRGMLTASAASIAAIAGFGFVGDENGGFPSRVKEAMPGYLTALYEGLTDYEVDASCKDGEANGVDRPLCTVFPAKGETHKLAVMGDSHAWSLSPAFATLPEARGVTVLLGATGACPPLLGVYRVKGDAPAIECHDFAQAAAREVVKQGVETVVLGGRWSLYVSGEFGSDRVSHGLSPTPGPRFMSTAERQAGLAQALKDTIAFYRDAGIRVILVEEVPLQWVRADETVARAILLRLDDETSRQMFRDSYVSRTQSDALQQPARRVLNEVAEETGVEVIRLLDYFVEGDQYVWLRDEDVLYTDSNHLSVNGALAMTPFVESVLVPR
ncbi:hypothetical protein DC366_01365 [Pelagivirga sediminicola]|uniref:SGNH domain-containing protein n=1 Tax=Pelagivirga sediminicola TaxID=2170575 RepID=A0A2T7GB56_9RHOB|nr:acyltransferase family protein [Pelagivirga sediminicola]PVA11642.1 hypothetical protein DC366_01365 [Pelagivirga sediminicola]